MADLPARYAKPRRFIRAIESETYSLTEMRRQRLENAPEYQAERARSPELVRP